MTYKKMIETYLLYEMESETYNMFLLMYQHNLIDSRTWKNFFDTVNNWVFGDDGNSIYNMWTDEKIIERDSEGYLRFIK